MCDGPDLDSIASAYLPHTPISQQRAVSTGLPSEGNSFQRIDLTESGEKKKGGNGITGNDETSEWLDKSFTQAPPTPGHLLSQK